MDLSDQTRRSGATTALRIYIALAARILANDAAIDVADKKETQRTVKRVLTRGSERAGLCEERDS